MFINKSKIDSNIINEEIKKRAHDLRASFFGLLTGTALLCLPVFGAAYYIATSNKLTSTQEIGVYIGASAFCISFAILAFYNLFHMLQTMLISQLDALYNLLSSGN